MGLAELVELVTESKSFGPIVLAAFGFGSAVVSAWAGKKSNDANKKADKVEEKAKENAGRIEDHDVDLIRANRSLVDMITVMRSLSTEHDSCVEERAEWRAVRGQIFEVLKMEPPIVTDQIESEAPLRQRLLGILERRIAGQHRDVVKE